MFRAVTSFSIIGLLFSLIAFPNVGRSEFRFDRTGDEWRWVHFTVSSGLPSNRVDSYFESISGQLWVGTPNGLAVFDGFQWINTRQELGLPNLGANQILGYRADSLIVRMGMQVFIGKNGCFAKLPCNQVQKVLNYVDSTILILRRSKLLQYSKGNLRPLSIESRQFHDEIGNAWSFSTGELWLNSGRGLWSDRIGWVIELNGTKEKLIVHELFELDSSSFLVSIGSPSRFRGLWEYSRRLKTLTKIHECGDLVRSVAKDGNHIVIAPLPSGEVLIRENGGWSFMKDVPKPLENPEFVTFLADSRLMIGSSKGLYLFNPNKGIWAHHHNADMTLWNRIHDILISKSGQMVLATVNGIEIRPNGYPSKPLRFAAIGTHRLDVITGLAEDSAGDIWISSGSGFGGAYRFDGLNWKHYSARFKDQDVYFHKIRKDRKGRLRFLGIDHGRTNTPSREPGIFELQNDSIVRLSYSAGLRGGRLYCFEEGEDGALWFGTNMGLFKYDSGRWTHWNASNGLGMDKVYSLAVDSSNRIWYSDRFSGVGSIDQAGKAARFSIEDGLVSNYVNDIRVDQIGNVWFAASTGLGMYSGGKFHRFDQATGIGLPELNCVAFHKDLVIAGSEGGGLAILNMRNVIRRPPRVILEQSTADEKSAVLRWRPFAAGGELPPHEILCRYRIDDGEWSKWALPHDVLVSNLSPGEHTYQVQAQGLYGQYSDEGARGTFTIILPYYQQAAFYLPIITFVSLTAGIAFVINKRRRNPAMAPVDTAPKFHTIADATNSAIILYDKGRIVYANQKAQILIGYSQAELEFFSFYDFFQMDLRPTIISMEKSRNLEKPLECLIQTQSKASKWVELSTREISFQNRTMMLASLHDLGPRMKAESTLKEHEQRFLHLITNAPISILHIDSKGFCDSANNHWSVLTGQSEKQALGLGWSDTIYPEDRQAVLSLWYYAIAARSPFTKEFRIRLETGPPAWVSATSVPGTSESETTGTFVVVIDITDRKEAERILAEYKDKVLTLTKELTSTEERERRRIAVYLHDCVGQSLAFCRMKIQEWRESGQGTDHKEFITDIQAMIEQSIHDTRSLTFELSPPVLHEIGLAQAVDMLVDHMNKLAQTRFTLKTPVAQDRLSHEQRAILYQTARELMRNVLKHAHAKEASISLESTPGMFRIRVEDNGVGFEPPSLSDFKGKTSGYGIKSVRERLSFIGGTLTIDTLPGKGTLIIASLPLL